MRSDLSTYEFCCALDPSVAISGADRQLGLALAYDPDQARADDGKWTSEGGEGGGGGGGGGGKSEGGGGDKSKGKKVAPKRDLGGYSNAEQRAAMAKGPELSKKLGQQVSVFANGKVFDDLGEHIGDYDGTNFKPKGENPIIADAEKRAESSGDHYQKSSKKLASIVNADSGVQNVDTAVLEKALRRDSGRPTDDELDQLVMGGPDGEVPDKLKRNYPHTYKAIRKYYK